MQIVEVRCDDWSWIYIDGVSVNDEGVGHELENNYLVNLISDYIKERYPNEMGGLSFETRWIDDNYAESGLPHLLDDIPQDKY